MSSKPEPDMATLQADLYEASADYVEARDATEAARHRETDALNRLNAAQKAMEDGFAHMRRIAPSASDWKTSSDMLPPPEPRWA